MYSGPHVQEIPQTEPGRWSRGNLTSSGLNMESVLADLLEETTDVQEAQSAIGLNFNGQADRLQKSATEVVEERQFAAFSDNGEMLSTVTSLDNISSSVWQRTSYGKHSASTFCLDGLIRKLFNQRHDHIRACFWKATVEIDIALLECMHAFESTAENIYFT
ncbi:hypothetical protein M514_23721 [Trichuris suis]|uniref:Uncharacterized protein n=1 Tax=Trichuris suis TaxID=68888 RepID=A0A085N3U4_9BILA|nr:hypothetical protein M514_23721 [Trichuris suis]